MLGNPNEVVNIKIIPDKSSNVSGIELLLSPSIDVVDSLIKVADGSYIASIRFVDILDNPYSRIVLRARVNNSLNKPK